MYTDRGGKEKVIIILGKTREYLDEDYLRGIVRSHGVQIGVRYAEVFETDRYIIR